MILSNKRRTRALIRLRGCAGWSATVLFTNPEDMFSRVVAHIKGVKKVRYALHRNSNNIKRK